jgi:death-on-curing protein
VTTRARPFAPRQTRRAGPCRRWPGPLVRNHALVDGNKRLAWAATRVFCLLNGRDITYTVDEAEALMLAAAAGGLDVPDVATWLRHHLSGAS